MAREIVFYETAPAEIVKIVEVLTPEPGAGEIRIRVKAIGLNRAEANFRVVTFFAAIMRGMTKLPVTEGMEGSRKKKIITTPCMVKSRVRLR